MEYPDGVTSLTVTLSSYDFFAFVAGPQQLKPPCIYSPVRTRVTRPPVLPSMAAAAWSFSFTRTKLLSPSRLPTADLPPRCQKKVVLFVATLRKH